MKSRPFCRGYSGEGLKLAIHPHPLLTLEGVELNHHSPTHSGINKGTFTFQLSPVVRRRLRNQKNKGSRRKETNESNNGTN